MNWNDIKLLSRKELEKIVPRGFSFHTRPWTNQLASFLAAIACLSPEKKEKRLVPVKIDGFADTSDMGVGKTKVAIDVCRYIDFVFHASKGKVKVLVVCLNSAVENWADEVRLHSQLRPLCVRGKDRLGLVEEMSASSNFFIMSYEGLRAALSRRRKLPKGAKVRHRTKIDRSCVKRLLAVKFDALVVDESHKVKSPTSRNFRILATLGARIPFRLLLTGTPFGNSLLDLWAQYYLLDRGKTFASSFSKYRDIYFEDRGRLLESRGIWIPNYAPSERGLRILQSKLYSKAIRYSESEVADLPDKVYRVVKYTLSREQEEAYSKATEDLLKVASQRFKRMDAANKSMVFRQICSGFIKKSNFVFKSNPKLDLLEDLLEGLVSEHKVVIFHEFIMEEVFIESLLKKMGVGYAVLGGRTKDKHAHIRRFEEERDCRVVIAHPLSGGASINLVSATYCVFFSNGDKVINRLQCEKRIHRKTQRARRVFYYDLIGANTIENTIVHRLRKGVDVFYKTLSYEEFKRVLRGQEEKSV